MAKRNIISSYFKFSLACAILYAIPMYVFLSDQSYRQIWWLYLGNALFLCGVAIFMIFFNNRRDQNASTATTTSAGHIVTIMGTIIAFIIALISVLIMVPSAFGLGSANSDLGSAPPGMRPESNQGLLFVLFADAILGNISAGSAIALILGYSYKRDQTKDKAKI